MLSRKAVEKLYNFVPSKNKDGDFKVEFIIKALKDQSNSSIQLTCEKFGISQSLLRIWMTNDKKGVYDDAKSISNPA
jgi:hypothetical protein